MFLREPNNWNTCVALVVTINVQSEGEGAYQRQ